MARQYDPTRRKFFTRSLGAVPAVALAGTGLGRMGDAIARDREPQRGDESLSAYTPGYFQDDEWAFLLAACDRLIPAEEAGAGALAANVPVFIDRQMQTPYGEGGLWYMQGPFHTNESPQLGYQLKFTPRETYRTGIADVQQYCRDTFDGKPFQSLTEEEQIGVLTDLEKGRIALPNIPASSFFQLLWTNTREGYLSDPQYGGNKDMAGWKAVGFPGARADFMDWIEQPDRTYPLGPVPIHPRRG